MYGLRKQPLHLPHVARQVDKEIFKKTYNHWELMTGLQEVHFIGEGSRDRRTKDDVFKHSRRRAKKILQHFVANRITFHDGDIVYDAPSWHRARFDTPQFQHPFDSN